VTTNAAVGTSPGSASSSSTSCFSHASAGPARFAAGAEQQGRLFPFVDVWYANQGQENSGYATDEFLRGVTTSAGVDADRAMADAQSDAAADRLNAANAEAQTRGIDSTPSFVVTGPEGKTKVVVGHDAAAVAAAIEAVK
jgi:predicted DsbA family dithiol-disulfide isomerase